MQLSYEGELVKACAGCGREKPLPAFNRKGKRLHSYCKPCLYVYQMRRWNRKKIAAVAYLGGTCQDCGRDGHPAGFDFHHRGPTTKEHGWSKLRLMSWVKIVAELDKCDLLCAWCHRLRHINPDLW